MEEYFVKMLAIKVDPFESSIIAEKNFGLTIKDTHEANEFKTEYETQGCDVRMYYLENPKVKNDE